MLSVGDNASKGSSIRQIQILEHFDAPILTNCQKFIAVSTDVRIETAQLNESNVCLSLAG